MPRFFFHITGKMTELDSVGTELPSAAYAKREGVKLLGALLQDGLHDAHSCAILLEVMDETGLILFHIDLTTWDAPIACAA